MRGMMVRQRGSECGWLQRHNEPLQRNTSLHLYLSYVIRLCVDVLSIDG